MFVTYHKMNKKLLLSGKQIQQIQPRLTPRGFSVELLHTDSALSLQKIATKSHNNIKNKDKAMITEDSSLPLSFEGRIGLSKR